MKTYESRTLLQELVSYKIRVKTGYLDFNDRYLIVIDYLSVPFVSK